MTALNYLGYALLASPFVGIFAVAVQAGGLGPAIGIFAAAAAIVCVIGVGIYLIGE